MYYTVSSLPKLRTILLLFLFHTSIFFLSDYLLAQLGNLN